ncbi:hypothetical protein Dxin01_00193 [Deinococcus xinjiangensis]|uniref:Uncharacterized protein n=1 Tax=Deinococcus xinjiangensis TaxID=457454 RepID=A0ABP9V5B2_9DEIO
MKIEIRIDICPENEQEAEAIRLADSHGTTAFIEERLAETSSVAGSAVRDAVSFYLKPTVTHTLALFEIHERYELITEVAK